MESYNYSRGRGRNDGRNAGRGGRLNAHHQPGGGGGRGFTFAQPKQRWRQRQNSNPSSSTESSKSDHSHSHSHSQTHRVIGAPTVSDRKGENIRPMNRPDKGGKFAIRTCQLQVNHFLVSFGSETVIRQYSMVVEKADAPRRNNQPQNISKSDLAMIREKLFSDHLLQTAYDGEKNIFSAVDLREGNFVVNVSKGEDERTVSYSVTLSLVRRLELSRLKDYLGGKSDDDPRTILQGLDLVVKENPSKCTVPLGRCFFPVNRPITSEDLRRGVIAIAGFQQSLKPTSQGLSLCLDHSVLAFRKKMSVLDFLHDHIPGFNLRVFWRFKTQVEKALVGLKVNVTHRRTKQKYTIAKLTPRNTKDIKFSILDPEGRNPPMETRLVDYFREKYGVRIENQDIPALDFGGNKTNYVPMELCVLVEGQRYPKEDLESKAAEILKNMSLARPWDRQALIQAMVMSDVGPCGGDIIQNFGMSINTSMTGVIGRVIEPPNLKLRNPRGKDKIIKLHAKKCNWNLVGASMVEGKPVECWGILEFKSSESGILKADEFIEKFISKYKKLGIDMEMPILHEYSDMWSLEDYNSLCELLEKFDAKARSNRQQLQFLLCVMAKKHQGYKCLKWIAETKVGIVTQCCLAGNANKATDQYLTNLALKINAKIGGSNVELENRLPHFEGEGHVMFIGADVNHPGSQDRCSPSIAAVVATVNWPASNRYAARVCAQDNRTEKILNFGEVCYDLVLYYDRLNKVRPEKIVIFRDGVSESQFRMVLEQELGDLKSVFRASNYFPTITLIVAQKRHQTRFFPVSMEDGIKGNVYPGTVVDTKVVHPFEFDFYLCSHHGSLGTSKPTHYHVLRDDHKFTSDDLQKLIYDLCFTFARCTTPVSLVPPVYYADLTAYRGRLYYEAMMSLQSPASAVSSSSPMAPLSTTSTGSSLSDPGFSKLHTEVENIMFFI